MKKRKDVHPAVLCIMYVIFMFCEFVKDKVACYKKNTMILFCGLGTLISVPQLLQEQLICIGFLP